MKIAYRLGKFYQFEATGYGELISDPGFAYSGFIHKEVTPKVGDAIFVGNHREGATERLPTGLALDDHGVVVVAV